jgi:DNA-binding response OmpR family regulator
VSSPPPNEYAHFLALHEDVQPVEYALEADICTIGRSPACQIIVSRQIVSRLHAKIEREGHRYILRDAGSANGTYINGHRIHEPYLLKHRDLIGLGETTAALRFIDPDPTFERPDVLRYDERKMTFFLGQQPLDLTGNQFRLLHHLYQHLGDVCTRESCAEAIWGREYDPGLDAQALDGVCRDLRRRLREIALGADPIKTHRGFGYELIL